MPFPPIHQAISQSLADKGYAEPTAVQAAVLQDGGADSDLLVSAQTGSGKTAAFAIPAIEKTDPANRAVQVLILCPTRELAVQVCEEVHNLFWGGVPLGREPNTQGRKVALPYLLGKIHTHVSGESQSDGASQFLVSISDLEAPSMASALAASRVALKTTSMA